ncbi:MAG TPA: FHA domain-containing protein, partial [Kofleriaceae bacterium]|nr:FHA domain-containing protein [Kofleriaceae bacterium]
MTGRTETLVSGSPLDAAAATDWALIAALDCERLAAPPLRVALAACTEVELGRGAACVVWIADGRAGQLPIDGQAGQLRIDGPAGQLRIDGRPGQLRIDLADRWASHSHARLVRDGAGWLVHDCGSKNGTRVNGERVERAALGDGDVLEVGATFQILRRC